MSSTNGLKQLDSNTGIPSITRWHDAVMAQELRATAAGADAGHNSPAARWHRACVYARHLVADPSEDLDTNETPKWTRREDTVHKLMEANYWLEMIDQHHRKASNLNKYHKFWDEQYQGTENFFYWLDHGEGRHIDLEECPRKRLEDQRVIYLSTDQRQNYLVKISPEGKLVWARDGRFVDTRRGYHKDAGEGRGIIDIDPEEDSGSDTNSAANADDDDDDDVEVVISDDDGSGVIDLGMAMGQQNLAHWTVWGRLKNAVKPLKPTAPAPIKKRKKERKAREISAGLRRPKGPKTWIFVVDSFAKLYVGVKQAGYFQHSSFLFGSRVMAAGLIKVKSGTLTSLVPLSGHYKSGTPHFKRFAEILRESGCDMSHVSVNKGLVTIGAVEQYGAMTKWRRSLFQHVKSALLLKHTPTHKEDDRRDQERAEARQRSLDSKKVWANLELPHDGRPTEDLTLEERAERGAALVARAMGRGLGRDAISNASQTQSQT